MRRHRLQGLPVVACAHAAQPTPLSHRLGSVWAAAASTRPSTRPSALQTLPWRGAGRRRGARARPLYEPARRQVCAAGPAAHSPAGRPAQPLPAQRAAHQRVRPAPRRPVQQPCRRAALVGACALPPSERLPGVRGAWSLIGEIGRARAAAERVAGAAGGGGGRVVARPRQHHRARPPPRPPRPSTRERGPPRVACPGRVSITVRARRPPAAAAAPEHWGSGAVACRMLRLRERPGHDAAPARAAGARVRLIFGAAQGCRA